MKKLAKISVLIAIPVFLFYSQVLATVINPPGPEPIPLPVIITTNIINGDDTTFHFDINDPYGNNFDGFNISTQNKMGTRISSSVLVADISSNIQFEIKETLPSGWQVENISCSGGGLIESGTTSPTSILVTAQLPDVNCTFDNSKTGSANPVLIVPGILGTEMEEGENLLWADINKLVNPFVSDSFMDPLQFGSNLFPIVNIDLLGVLGKKAFSIGNVEVRSYDYSDGLTTELKNQGYVEDQTLFTFPYDWRYGVSGGDELNVKALKQKIADILAQTGANKVDVIAHSMGGLIVKKYVMENPDSHHIDKAIFVGVPNFGAPKAIKTLLEGDNFNIFGLNDQEIKKIVQNMPVAYDLMPGQEYYRHFDSIIQYINSVYTYDIFGGLKNIINYTKAVNVADVKNFLTENDDAFNTTAYDNSQTLHSSDFDNFDVRSEGVDAYNIIGCGTATIGGISRYDISLEDKLLLKQLVPTVDSGDGTVPYGSAKSVSVDASKEFLAIKADHGKMLSANGIRQKITNIISGSSLPTGTDILNKNDFVQDPSKCELTGYTISIFSPLDISITDNDGNKSQLAEDGSIQNDIPGADYEIWGEHKFVYLPTDEGESYQIGLKGTGDGTFTLKVGDVVAGTTTGMQIFSNIPVTTDLAGKLNISNGQPNLQIDQNGDGTIDETLEPTSVVNGDSAEDLVPPITTAVVSGTEGKTGFYRSNVTISLSAIDPVVPGLEGETSGLLETKYNLDNAGFKDYSPSLPIKISSEGTHIIQFFSTDKAGNNEPVQMIAFTIDKTPPEFSIRFNPNKKDIQFTGIDNVSTSSAIVINDNDDRITATDEAGNKTQLLLKDKNRKKNLKAEIGKLIYNGTAADLRKNKISFEWNFDKKGNLKELEQSIKNKKDYNIEAEYEDGKTKIEGRDQIGKIKKTLPGLILLNIKTNKGDLDWSY